MSESSGEKTEQPTDKRLRDARKKGQVSKSQDLTSAMMLISAVLVIWISGSMTANVLLKMMRGGIETAGSFEGMLTKDRALDLLNQGVLDMALALAPLFIFLFAAAFLFNYIQVGSIFGWEGLKPEMNKINPAEGFKQKFLKARPYVELAKTILKSIITFVVVAWVLYAEIPNLVMLSTRRLMLPWLTLSNSFCESVFTLE